MDNLLRLVERVEAATGPDRELDCDIARYRRVTVMKHDPETGENFETTHWHYTASLDAAMTLVPKGWAFSLGEMMGLPIERRWRCHLRDHNEPYNPATCAWVDKDLSTPALAICAAALRARIIQESSNG